MCEYQVEVEGCQSGGITNRIHPVNGGRGTGPDNTLGQPPADNVDLYNMFEGFYKTITTELPSTAEMSLPISSDMQIDGIVLRAMMGGVYMLCIFHII